jgi:hypothetical protein
MSGANACIPYGSGEYGEYARSRRGETAVGDRLPGAAETGGRRTASMLSGAGRERGPGLGGALGAGVATPAAAAEAVPAAAPIPLLGCRNPSASIRTRLSCVLSWAVVNDSSDAGFGLVTTLLRLLGLLGLLAPCPWTFALSCELSELNAHSGGVSPAARSRSRSSSAAFAPHGMRARGTRKGVVALLRFSSITRAADSLRTRERLRRLCTKRYVQIAKQVTKRAAAEMLA